MIDSHFSAGALFSQTTEPQLTPSGRFWIYPKSDGLVYIKGSGTPEAGIGSDRLPLSGGSLSGTLTIVPQQNTPFIIGSGFLASGTNSSSMVDLSGVWNTTGTPTAININLTDTASSSNSLLMDLKINGSSRFTVGKDNVQIGRGPAWSYSGQMSVFAASQHRWNTNGVGVTIQTDTRGNISYTPNWNSAGTTYTGMLVNVTDAASSGNSLLMDLQVGGVSRLSVSKTGHLQAVTKSFVIDHPTYSDMKLHYGSLESPYHGVRLTGKSATVDGCCIVQLPHYMCDLVHESGISIQLTPISHFNPLCVTDINLPQNYFAVGCQDFGDNGFYWDFTAIRKDVEQLEVETHGNTL